MSGQEQKNTPFYEDVYLYDLNQTEAKPLAYRSARGGEVQPDLLSLIPLPARAWYEISAQLDCGTVFRSENGGAVILPVQGSIGRFAVVVKTALSLPALAYVVQNAGLNNAYVDALIRKAPPKPNPEERPAAESAVRIIDELHQLIDACGQVNHVFNAEECIQNAAKIMGVSLLPFDKAEVAPVQGQGAFSQLQHSGQILFVCVMTLLSVIRNHARARSGWLYAIPCQSGYTLQGSARTKADADLEVLLHLRRLLEDYDVAYSARTVEAPVKPPKQYAYLHRKITDPRKPLCARCQCLDHQCKTCMITSWAVLPYVCDAALLGIKALPYFES